MLAIFFVSAGIYCAATNWTLQFENDLFLGCLFWILANIEEDEVKYHIQCKMQKGSYIQTSWIPEKYAKIGKFLKLKENGKWENGWQVVAKWGRQKSKDVFEQMDAWKHQREVTDI